MYTNILLSETESALLT